MNTSRLLLTLIAALGLAISSGCGTRSATPDSQPGPAVENMNIVIPESTDSEN